jgi:hypothetical protein
MAPDRTWSTNGCFFWMLRPGNTSCLPYTVLFVFQRDEWSLHVLQCVLATFLPGFAETNDLGS